MRIAVLPFVTLALLYEGTDAALRGAVRQQQQGHRELQAATRTALKGQSLGFRCARVNDPSSKCTGTNSEWKQVFNEQNRAAAGTYDTCLKDSGCTITCSSACGIFTAPGGSSGGGNGIEGATIGGSGGAVGGANNVNVNVNVVKNPGSTGSAGSTGNAGSTGSTGNTGSTGSTGSTGGTPSSGTPNNNPTANRPQWFKDMIKNGQTTPATGTTGTTGGMGAGGMGMRKLKPKPQQQQRDLYAYATRKAKAGQNIEFSCSRANEPKSTCEGTASDWNKVNKNGADAPSGIFETCKNPDGCLVKCSAACMVFTKDGSGSTGVSGANVGGSPPSTATNVKVGVKVNNQPIGTGGGVSGATTPGTGSSPVANRPSWVKTGTPPAGTNTGSMGMSRKARKQIRQ